MKRSVRWAAWVSAWLVGMSVLVAGALPAEAAAGKDPKDKSSQSKSTGKKKKKKTKKKARTKVTRFTCSRAAGGAGETVSAVPWQQEWLSPDRLAPLATGSGQVVAVLDSGVNDEQEQMGGGRVLSGYDAVEKALGANQDCVSHGTGVAGLIVANRSTGIGFRGIASGAKILPVRVSTSAPASALNGTENATPARVATGIRWAAKNGATVIEVSSAFTTGGQQLCSAVKYATGRGIPVVAAVGDLHDSDLESDPKTYPAACDGAIGVGSVGEDFAVSDTSVVNSTVDVVAPGDAVVSANRIAGQDTLSGTSLAAGIVAGSVALLRQSEPSLTPEQITGRIVASADPMPAGELSLAYGAGLIDPYRALTETASTAQSAAIAGVAAPTTDAAAVRADSDRRRARVVAVSLAAAAVGTTLLLMALALLVPRGRRRGWQPGRAGPVRRVPAKPIPVEEEALFTRPEAPRG